MAKKGYIRKKNQAILDVIAVNLREYRNQKNISVEKLAVLCDMEAKAIYNYEHGKVDISASSIATIATHLEIEPHQLLVPEKKTSE